MMLNKILIRWFEVDVNIQSRKNELWKEKERKKNEEQETEKIDWQTDKKK